MEVKAIKAHGMTAGMVATGLIGAHAITSFVPVQNEKIKALIPFAAGATAALASKNKNVQIIGAGAMAYGTIKLLRALLMGNDPSGTNGIQGIADNPSVRKVLDMLLPNLGNTDQYTMNLPYEADNYFEPAIVDVPFEEVEDVAEFEQMTGVTNGFDQESLLGFPEDNLLGADYDNELYL